MDAGFHYNLFIHIVLGWEWEKGYCSMTYLHTSSWDGVREGVLFNDLFIHIVLGWGERRSIVPWPTYTHCHGVGVRRGTVQWPKVYIHRPGVGVRGGTVQWPTSLYTSSWGGGQRRSTVQWPTYTHRPGGRWDCSAVGWTVCASVECPVSVYSGSPTTLWGIRIPLHHHRHRRHYHHHHHHHLQ